MTFSYEASYGQGKGQHHVKGTVTAADEESARAQILKELARDHPIAAQNRHLRIQSITPVDDTPPASLDELACVVQVLDAIGVPKEIAPGQPYSLHGRVQAAIDGERENKTDDPASRFRVSLETRTVVVDGVLKVDVSSLNAASAWAELVEKLEALGLRVVEIPASDRGWLRVQLEQLHR